MGQAELARHKDERGRGAGLAGKQAPAVLCPAGAPPGRGDEYRAFDYVHLLALAGLPAASVPGGSENGLPIGVQVAAGAFCEHVLLAAAAAIEARVDPVMA